MKSYKKFKLVGLLLGALFMSNIACASLLLEPHLAYNLSGSGDNGLSGASKVEYDYSGAQYGMRVGYQVLGFMTGLDFTRSSYDQEYKSTAATTTGSVGKNELGIFVGYNLPILLRAWATYYFSNTAKDSTYNSEMSGNTTELGVGFTGFPFISINLMYRMISFDEFKASTGVKSTIDVSNHEVALGVSLPLTL